MSGRRVSSPSAAIGLAAFGVSLVAIATFAACEESLPKIELTDSGSPEASLPTPPREDGSTTAPAPVPCGASTCASARYQDVIDLPGCCTTAGTCGLDLLPLGGLRPVPSSCTALAAAGAPNEACEGVVLESARDGGAPTIYQGCCRPSGTCGIVVNLGEGLDFGCQAAGDFIVDAGPGSACAFDASTD